jgi:acetyl-CoA acetyltransferase
MDDYLAARMISSPLCLFDCDTAADASTAIIVSATDQAVTSGSGRTPIKIESVGTALHGRDSWDQFEDLSAVAAMNSAAAMMWSRTDLTPSDVDVAQLYDGFSFFTLAWLEALGFCDKGQSGAFVEGGGRIALDGELPLNTDGGQLAAGKRHGFGFLYEACQQLWGTCGERQVAGDPSVAVVAVGGGPQSTCLLLSRG